MTNSIEIENYKSIKHLKLDTARVNVFIGEPNSGKSNILEALAWLSQDILNADIHEIFRFASTEELFFDSNIGNSIEVKTDKLSLQLYLGKTEQGTLDNNFKASFFQEGKEVGKYDIAFDGSITNRGGVFSTRLLYYAFGNTAKNSRDYFNHLRPPYGNNLSNLLINNPELRKLIADILKRKGLRLQLNSIENKMSVVKEVDEIIYSYPYKAVSETLRRLIFYKLAIATNENCSLIFDEPEANTFPLFTKEIGEMIAMNSNNQFFITTHNPYLLRSIITKTPGKDLKVFITSLKDYETRSRALTEKELSEVLDLDMDFFFNLPE